MIQTIIMKTSQDTCTLGQGIVQGKFQGNSRCWHVDGLNQTDQYIIYGPVYGRVYGPVYSPSYGRVYGRAYWRVYGRVYIW